MSQSTPTPSQLVGIAEIAHLAKVSTQAVGNWRARYSASFPPPIADLASGPVFRLPQIVEWLKTNRRLIDDGESLLRTSKQDNGLQLICQPTGATRLGDLLNIALRDQRWTHYRGAVAFAKSSGVKHIAEAATSFAHRSDFKVAVGVDLCGTSRQGLEALLHAAGTRGEVYVFNNALPFTFHPKAHLFRNETSALAIIGSGNLTQGGLYTNYEMGVQIGLNLKEAHEREFISELEARLDAFLNTAAGTSRRLDSELLAALVARNYVYDEASQPVVHRGNGEGSEEGGPAGSGGGKGLFEAVGVPAAPHVVVPSGVERKKPVDPPPSPLPDQELGEARGFLMTLQRTDAGVGQATKGTARRSPEIFIPLAAREAMKGFWGWPDSFQEDRDRPGKFDRIGVRFRLGTKVIPVNMMTWPVKHDFRLRSEALRSEASIGDILRLERLTAGAGADYYAEIVPQGTTEFDRYQRLCTNPVRNSTKRWGYY